MSESHVVTGLVAKRSVLTGQIEHFQSQIRQLSMDLDHLDATLQLFNPDYDLLSIKPKGIRSTNPWFIKGEITRLTLETLRTELDPILWKGKLMIFYQLVRSFHETYSPSFIYRRI